MTTTFKKSLTPGPIFTKKFSDVVAIGSASAYAYRARPTLTAINITTDQAIAMTSDGHISTVLDQWTAPAGIQVDNDFVTEWQGSLVGEVSEAANLEIILHTKHEFNGKTITNSRHYFFDVAAGVRWTVPLNVFDSRAQVKLGTFSGTPINANDIAAAAVITYSFEIVSHGRKTEVARSTNTLKYLKSLNIGTISYQLQRAVSVGGGNGSGDGDDNVQSDWDQTDNTADDYIRNKPDIPDEVDVSTIRQLPTFPDAGDRDNKIPKWDGDVLGWETDASGTDGASDFSDLNGKITEGQIPDDILVNRMYKDDQITKDKFVTGVRDSLDKADAAQALSDSVQSVDALPTTIPDVNTAFLLRDPVDGNDEGLYIVKEDAEDYYEGFVSPSSDSVIGLEANLDHNPNGSMREIEWTINGVHIYAEFTPAAFSGTPPANLYIEALNVDADGDTIDSTNVLSDTDRMNSRAVLVRESVFDRDGNYSYGNQLTHDTLVFWGGVDDGARIRFKVYSDSAYSTPLIAAGGKYYDLITDNKFPRQMILERLSQGGASNGQILAWNDAKQSWLPATESSGAKTYVRGASPLDDSASVEAAAANDDDTWIQVPTGTGSPISVWTKDEGVWLRLGIADYSEEQIILLKHLTRDIHVINKTVEWSDAKATDGALSYFDDAPAVTLTAAEFNTNGASVTIPSSVTPRITAVVVRVLKTTDISTLRVVGHGATEGGNNWALTSNYDHITVPDGDTYDYYITIENLQETAELTFQLEKREEIEHTRYDGTLGGEALKQIDAAVAPIADIKHLTRDIHQHDEDPVWENATDLEGIIHFELHSDGVPVTITNADFDGGASGTIPANAQGDARDTFIYVRLPANVNRQNYRLQVNRTEDLGNYWVNPDNHGDTRASSLDDNFQYWFALDVHAGTPISLQLQKHSVLATTEYYGTLSNPHVVERMLPALPKAGERNDKIPKFDGDTLGWEVDSGGSGGGAVDTDPIELHLDAAAVTVANDRWRAITLASTPHENSTITIRHFQYDGSAIDEGVIGAVTFKAKEWLDLPVWTTTGTQTNTLLTSGNILGFQAIWVPDKALASLTNAHIAIARYSDTSMGVLFTSTNNQALRITEYPAGGTDGEDGDDGTDGVQGPFYFRLYNKSNDKPTAGTYDYDNDTFTVTPNTWTINTPVVDETKGERLYAIEAPIDPRNDAGKTIDLTDSGRWGSVFPVDGKDGQGFNFDDFPSVANYDDNDLVTVTNRQYELATTDDTVPNLIKGIVGHETITLGGIQWRGIASPQTQSGVTTGEFTENPDNAIAWVLASNMRHIRTAIEKSAYEAAKGSAFASSDEVAIKVTGESTNVDEAVLEYYSSYRRNLNGTDTTYYIFSHRHASDNYDLFSEDEDHEVVIETFTVSSGSATTTPFLTHMAAQKHWIHHDTETDSTAARALALALGNQSRLDAFDASVGLAEPTHTKTYDENTALTAPTLGNDGDNAVETTFSSIKPDDLLFFEYKNFDHLNHHGEHIIPGSTEASGQMFVRAGNFDASEFNGEFGNAVDKARQNDGSADTLNSWVVATVIYSGSNLTFALHLQQGGNRANRNLLPPVGFEIKMSIYRATAASAQLGLLHTEVATVKSQVGDLKFVDITQTAFDALTPDDDTIYFVDPDA